MASVASTSTNADALSLHADASGWATKCNEAVSTVTKTLTMGESLSNVINFHPSRLTAVSIAAQLGYFFSV